MHMSILAQPNLPTPLPVSERRAKTAKADLRISEKSEAAFYARLGGCMAEVQHAFGLTLKEFAGELGKNESQIRRQMEGHERPQIEAVFVVERFQGPMVIALARLASGVEIDTVLHIRQEKRRA